MEKGKPRWWDDAVEFLKQDDLLAEVVKKYPDMTAGLKTLVELSWAEGMLKMQMEQKCKLLYWPIV